MYYSNALNVIVLEGLTPSSVIAVEGGDTMLVSTTDGRSFSFYHDQDCCESVDIHDIMGNVNDLITGGKIISVQEDISNENPSNLVSIPDYQDSFTWTTFTFTMENGKTVVVRWYGQSNGYYSESVSFCEATNL